MQAHSHYRTSESIQWAAAHNAQADNRARLNIHTTQNSTATLECFRLREYFSTFNWLYVTETAKNSLLLFFAIRFVRIICWERIKRSTLFRAHSYSLTLVLAPLLWPIQRKIYDNSIKFTIWYATEDVVKYSIGLCLWNREGRRIVPAASVNRFAWYLWHVVGWTTHRNTKCKSTACACVSARETTT